MLKNLEKGVKNVKKQEKPSKKIEIRQKGRKHGKTIKMSKIKQKTTQECRKIVKNVENLEKPSKMSKNR